MVRRQDFDRAAVDLPAHVFDRHLHGLDFACGQVAIDTGEAVHHRDLERRRLGLHLADGLE